MISAILALTKQLEQCQATSNPEKEEQENVAGAQDKPVTIDKEMAEDHKTSEEPGIKGEEAEVNKDAKEKSHSDAKTAVEPH